MTMIKYYIGAWSDGYAPTDNEVINGINAVTHVIVYGDSGDVVTTILSGLSGGTDYDIEAVAEDGGSNLIRFLKLNVATPVGIRYLAIDDISATGTIQQNNILQDNQLACNDVSASNKIQQQSILQTQDLSCNDLTSTSEVQQAEIISENILVAKDVISHQNIQQEEIGQTNDLSAQGITGPPKIQQIAISQNHLLSNQDVSASSTVQQIKIDQVFVLSCKDVSSTAVVNSAEVGVTHSLSVQDTSAASTISEADIVQTNSLSVNDLSSSGQIQSGAIDVPFGITKVYAEETGNTPVFWNERGVIEGKFGVAQGFVYVDLVQSVVDSWQDHKIIFTAPLAGRDNGNYTVHVDRPE